MKKFSAVLVLTAGILWGLIGIFVKKLTAAGFGSPEIVEVRALSTVLLLGLFLLLFRRELLRIRLKDLWCFLGTGILSIVFFNYCYFRAISETSLAIAAVLLYTAPAFVMVISRILFREKITLLRLTALAGTFLGCVLVTGLADSAETVRPVGILIGLGAGFGYALYSVFSRFALERGYRSLTISFYTFLFAAVGTLPLADLSFLGRTFSSDPGSVGFCLLFGLFSTVIPYLVYTMGLKELENSRASILASIEPVTAAVLSVAGYHEPLSVRQAVGMILILTAILLCNFEKKAGVNHE